MRVVGEVLQQPAGDGRIIVADLAGETPRLARGTAVPEVAFRAGERDLIPVAGFQRALDRFFAEAGTALGSYDIAVINAAIPAQGVTSMSEDDARYAVATDFTAYVLRAHKAAAALGDKGDVILVGSLSAHILGPDSSIYAGMKAGIAGFAEALRKELGNKGIKVGLIEPGKTGADFQYPDIPADKQREMIHEETMLRAEDIAVGVHYLLTQPRRAVVQQLTIAPRMQDKE